MSRGWIVLAVMAVLAVWPESVSACPVCFDSSDENRQAFLATTAFLSLLPLGMVTGAGLWLRKRLRDVESEESIGIDSDASGAP